MIVRQDKTYESNTDHPNTNWYPKESNLIIDETNESGHMMAKLYKENFPFVEVERNGNLITKVIVLEAERLAEQERLELEKFMEILIPTTEEIDDAKFEIRVINTLLEVGLI